MAVIPESRMLWVVYPSPEYTAENLRCDVRLIVGWEQGYRGEPELVPLVLTERGAAEILRSAVDYIVAAPDEESALHQIRRALYHVDLWGYTMRWSPAAVCPHPRAGQR